VTVALLVGLPLAGCGAFVAWLAASSTGDPIPHLEQAFDDVYDPPSAFEPVGSSGQESTIGTGDWNTYSRYYRTEADPIEACRLLTASFEAIGSGSMVPTSRPEGVCLIQAEPRRPAYWVALDGSVARVGELDTSSIEAIDTVGDLPPDTLIVTVSIHGGPTN
jgi:hypothetical protein